MTDYLVFLRGINVGGKNKVPMARLRELLEELGYSDVRTYIASGNAILRSSSPADAIKRRIEAALPTAYKSMTIRSWATTMALLELLT